MQGWSWPGNAPTNAVVPADETGGEGAAAVVGSDGVVACG
jgi:hypothetical protein